MAKKRKTNINEEIESLPEELQNNVDSNENIQEEDPKIINIFVYDLNGNMIKKAPYSKYMEIYEEIVNHNLENIDNAYNIYPGTQFPPKGFKWDNVKKEFIEKTLEEKINDKETDYVLPKDMKVIGNAVIVKTLKEKIEEGLIILNFDEIYDTETNIIREMSEREKYERSLITLDQLIINTREFIKRQYDTACFAFNSKYPLSAIQHFNNKKTAAINWMNLPQELKIQYLKPTNVNFGNYILLIGEINSNVEDDDFVSKIDSLASKIIEKSNENELYQAKLYSKFNEYSEKLKELVNKKEINYNVFEKLKNEINFNI